MLPSALNPGRRSSKSTPMCRARAGSRAWTRFISSRPTNLRSVRRRRAIEAVQALAEQPGTLSRRRLDRALREAIGRRYGLDPSRIICGNGSDELLALLAHVFLHPGDEGPLQPIRLSDLSDLHSRRGWNSGCRRGDGPNGERGRDPRESERPHEDRLSRQPEQSDRHLHSVLRGEAPARGPAAAHAPGDRRGLRRIRDPQRLCGGPRTWLRRRTTSS